MSSRDAHRELTGWLWTDNELRRFTLEIEEDGKFYGFWLADDYQDDQGTFDEVIERFGDDYYPAVESFKRDEPMQLTRWRDGQ